jgi:hypothetical protein
MKIPVWFAGLAVPLASAAYAADEETKVERIQAGPSGGRLITKVEPHAEFFVNAANRVEIRFVDAAGKVIPPGDQSVSVIMGDRSAPTKLAFTKEGDKLVSDRTIPAGNHWPTVVQIRPGPEGKAVLERFKLNLDACPECGNREYACICDHGHD